MNKSAIDRGLFSSTYYRTYKEQCNKNHSNGEEEFFTSPNNNTKGVKPFNYDKLNGDGFVPENTFVDSGDIIIGKCMPQKIDTVITYKDTSVSLKNNESGYIDKNSYGDKYFTNVNGDGYNFAKVRLRNMRVPTIGDKFSCYSPDHDILTTEGWISIDKLTPNHCVASLVENKLVYQYPTEVQKYDYSGNMYNIKTNQVDLLVTPNHRMYISKRDHKNDYSMELAEEIFNKTRHYKKNADVWTPNKLEVPSEFIYESDNLISYKLGNRVMKIEDWVKLIGIWYAEGCTCRDSYVQIAAHKQRVKNAILECNQSLKFEIRMRKERTNDTILNSWSIHDKDIAQFFEPLSVGSTHKILPSWVWHLPRNICRILIDGMMLGDGHWMKNGTRRYDTSSVMLRDDFQRLCLHAGYSANFYLKYAAGHSATKKDGYVITSTADAWRLTITECQNQPKVNKYKKQDKWVEYNGQVYCCTVPQGEGILYIRRNGTTVWSGNSRHGHLVGCGK
jgi:hypothetical protein